MSIVKIRYDSEVDVVYIKLSDEPITETEEDEAGVIVDLDAAGRVVGLELLNARDFFSLTAIERFEKAA